jgi:hypothetical protein
VKNTRKRDRKEESKKYYTLNKDRLTLQRKEWAVRNPDYYLKKTYGITLQQYTEMFLQQKGCCKICNTHQLVLKQKLAVDHCHVTNNIRGLLCHTCNLQLGQYEKNKEVFQLYLDESTRKWKEWFNE